MAGVPMLKTFPGRYATTSDQLHPRDLRGRARHVGLSAMSAAAAARGWTERMLAQPRIQFLLLHHVMEDEQVPLRTLLRTLARTHALIGYGEAVDRIVQGRIDEPAIAVSFDDGLRNGLHAARILAEFELSACFFVCPAMIGVTDYDRIRRFCHERLEIPPVPFLSWDDLGTLAGQGHEIGSHTAGHPDLSGLEDAALHDEIAGSLATLDEHLGTRRRHFAWPYGAFAHMTEAAAQAVFRAGYASCASGVRGAHGPGPATASPPCLRREHVMAGWPLRHTLYLLARSVEQSGENAGAWPEGWSIEHAVETQRPAKRAKEQKA